MTTFFSFVLKQNVFCNVLFFGLLIYGLFFSIPELPVERFPNVSFGEVVISTGYPGASAQDVERLVTEEIERAIRDMPKIEFVRSSSKAGFSTINVKFIDDSDYDQLYDECRLRVLGVQNRLPTVNGKPLTPIFNVSSVDDWLPVIQVNLMSTDQERPLSKRTLVLFAEKLQLELEQIPKVKEVKLRGDEAMVFKIKLDPEACRRLSVSLEDVQLALQLSGGSLPAGSLDTAEGEQNMVVDDRYRSREDLLSTVVRKNDSSLITLGDVVLLQSTGLKRMKGEVYNSVNGKDTVSVQVLKAPEGNAKTIKNEVMKRVRAFEEKHQKLPISLNTNLDTTIKIDEGLGVLKSSLTLALVLVMYAVFIFLSSSGPKTTLLVTAVTVASLLVMIRFHDWPTLQLFALVINTLLVFVTCRAAVLTITGVAFSFIGCLIVFQFSGYSLNEITLLGFVLTSGIIVDDAIVVIENIQRHREMGKGIFEASVSGTSEVFWPVFSASLTTVAAFLPMLLMTGSVGDFFSLVPISVSVALAMSIVECLLIMPVHMVELEQLSSKWRSREQAKKPSGESHVMDRITAFYDRCLNWCLGHRVKSLFAVSLLFLAALAILIQSVIGPGLGQRPLLKLKFFPDDTSNIQIKYSLPSGTTLSESDQFARQISNHLLDKGPGHIAHVVANAGLSINSSYKPIFGSHLGFMIVELPRKQDRQFEDVNRFIDEVRQDLEQRFETQGRQVQVSAQKDGPPVGSPIHVRLSGVNENEVVNLSGDLMEYIESGIESGPFKGINDLKSDRSNYSTTISFKTDRRQAALFGLSPQEVRFFAATLFDGAYVGDIRLEDGDYPIRVQLEQPPIADPIAMMNFPLLERDGRLLFFDDVGSFKREEQPSTLERRDFQRVVNITAEIKDNSVLQGSDFMASLRSWHDNNGQRYPGVVFSFGGESESTARSYRSLFSAFMISLFAIYGILAVQFKSYTQPFLIMANIVFSFTGVVLMTGLLGALNLVLPTGLIAAERAMITVNSFIAIVGLTGLVVNDAIVLIDFINQERQRGSSLGEAVRNGAHQRVRPIIMTTWSTIAGLLPLAIGIPDFSISWGPFATCFVAGLSVSTVMTLLIIPLLYEMLESLKAKAKP
jgi:HAE1 family hydrophobic/amphiphilic exporter-1